MSRRRASHFHNDDEHKEKCSWGSREGLSLQEPQPSRDGRGDGWPAWGFFSPPGVGGWAPGSRPLWRRLCGQAGGCAWDGHRGNLWDASERASEREKRCLCGRGRDTRAGDASRCNGTPTCLRFSASAERSRGGCGEGSFAEPAPASGGERGGSGRRASEQGRRAAKAGRQEGL